ncbi:rhodanese-related sulfurtransferase [Cyclobacteriaceae bacterium]|nr:rhodanese-related sulfurtransferase [Cyclobacteriaceae bacterium]
MQLYNRVDRRVLEEQMANDSLTRITLSFYQYHQIQNPDIFRNYFYDGLNQLGALGRIYIASEGINAQMSVPKENFDAYLEFMDGVSFLKGIRQNIAVEAEDLSFIKLTVKVRTKILADGLSDDTFDVTNKGKHLSAQEFNDIISKDDTVLIDMRNHYESEVGHFEGAVKPDVDTFRDSLPVIEEMLEPHKDQNIVMYCTGGIRCEKASAWFKHKGLENVHQLEGGIIEYTRQVKEDGLENKFIGKNFVFDKRMGERISEEVIAKCHQCGEACDTHTNCENQACHLLFIQCDKCKAKYDGCCSKECTDFIHLPEEEQERLRKEIDWAKVGEYEKGRIRPKLTEQLRLRLKSL